MQGRAEKITSYCSKKSNSTKGLFQKAADLCYTLSTLVLLPRDDHLQLFEVSASSTEEQGLWNWLSGIQHSSSTDQPGWSS
jgi:hypothetical protein